MMGMCDEVRVSLVVHGKVIAVMRNSLLDVKGLMSPKRILV